MDHSHLGDRVGAGVVEAVPVADAVVASEKPEGRPLCQAEAVRITEPVWDIQAVEPYQESKSQRGRKKTILTEGYVCPYPDCSTLE